MPKNNSKKPNYKKFIKKENKELEFKHSVEAVNVTLTHHTTLEQIEDFVPKLSLATWVDQPESGEIYEDLQPKTAEHFFNDKCLPGISENVRLIFCVSGIDMTILGHLVRHRLFSFSAQSVAARDCRNDVYLIPSTIHAQTEFSDRFKELCTQCTKLYADMLDSDSVHLFDARAILPRSMNCHVYMGGNLLSWVAFIKNRLDVQNHPQEDNIIALLVWREILKKYPKLKHKINLNLPDKVYIDTANTDVIHNLFGPAAKNDLFEWNEEDFVHPRHRDYYVGSEQYFNRRDTIIDEINNL